MHPLLAHLPQQPPFRFVDDVTEMDEQHIRGHYRFRADEYFYAGHFPGQPLTPGVILIECMAQIGLVAFGLHLLGEQRETAKGMAFSSSEVEFLAPVYPEQRVEVVAEKVYFRLGKLKVKAQLQLPDGVVAARGTLAGMVLRGR